MNTKSTGVIKQQSRWMLAGWALVIAACAMVLCPVPVDAEEAQPLPQTANLTPRFVAGRTARYEIWTLRNTAVAMSFQGQTQEMDSSLETQGEVTWRIDRVNADGSASCTMTLDWLTATSKSSETDPVTVDSRKSTEKTPMVELLKAIAGTPVTVEIAADGTVTRVRGVEAMHAKLSDAEGAPDEVDFQETASELAVIAAAQDQLAIGRSWKHEAAWNHELGKLNHDTTYTLTGIESVAGIPVATVSGTSKLRLDVDQSKFPPEGPKIDLKLKSGEATTQIMFDLSRGEAVGRNSTMTTEIEARISANGQVLTRSMTETIQSQSIRIAEK